MSQRAPRNSFVPAATLVLLVSVVLIPTGYSLPLETFRERLTLDCGEGERECTGVLRASNTLGRSTGISIVKGLEGEVSVRAGQPKGTLRIKAEEASDFSIAFSWDGDSNPDVLSGAGLNCLDLTRSGAYAFILSKLSAEPECLKEAIPSECPQFTVESRVYDSQDPTGQRFSASVMARGPMVESDLAVPFSNFVRSGPRGKGSFTCVGAVTITMRFSGLDELGFDLGPIYTNGEEGLEVPPTPSVPMPTAPSTPIPSAAETVNGELSAVEAIVAIPDLVATAYPKVSGTQNSNDQTQKMEISPNSASKQQPATIQAVAAENAPQVIKKTQKQPQEAVYGSVVIGD